MAWLARPLRPVLQIRPLQQIANRLTIYLRVRP
jgi:hypothetical protein